MDTGYYHLPHLRCLAGIFVSLSSHPCAGGAIRISCEETFCCINRVGNYCFGLLNGPAHPCSQPFSLTPCRDLSTPHFYFLLKNWIWFGKAKFQAGIPRTTPPLLAAQLHSLPAILYIHFTLSSYDRRDGFSGRPFPLVFPTRYKSAGHPWVFWPAPPSWNFHQMKSAGHPIVSNYILPPPTISVSWPVMWMIHFRSYSIPNQTKLLSKIFSRIFTASSNLLGCSRSGLPLRVWLGLVGLVPFLSPFDCSKTVNTKSSWPPPEDETMGVPATLACCFGRPRFKMQ